MPTSPVSEVDPLDNTRPSEQWTAGMSSLPIGARPCVRFSSYNFPDLGLMGEREVTDGLLHRIITPVQLLHFAVEYVSSSSCSASSILKHGYVPYLASKGSLGLYACICVLPFSWSKRNSHKISFNLANMFLFIGELIHSIFHKVLWHNANGWL